MDILLDLFVGIVGGVVYGGIASIAILSLSLVFRYFTNEKFPVFMSIVLGLGILGIGGGFLAILEDPTLGRVAEIIIASIVIVWSTNVGDQLAEKIPRGGGSIRHILRTRKPKYVTIKLPNSRLIRDISGKPRVPDDLKEELSEKEFIMPSDLPQEELANRLERRLMTDWNIGEASFELDDKGRILHIAVAAKDRGLSQTLPMEFVAAPIKCDTTPTGLAPGDFIRIYMGNNEVIDQIEVKNVDVEEKKITVMMSLESFERIRGKEACEVVAVPPPVRKPLPIEVEKRSGSIEEFDVEKIVSSTMEAGTSEEVAKEIAEKVKVQLAKATTPITTERIRKVVVEELRKSSPKVVKRFQKHQKN
jgi:hypothetical protein